ncbi:MAG: FIST C-terminal domain-containing protein [Magnetococcus sp. DMHC-1]|nr:FIST C-terminal domain-containing protein [Magnetococcales bacterium]
MEIRQVQFNKGAFATLLLEPLQKLEPMLVLVFADKKYFMDPVVISALLAAFPTAHCVGVSTAGEISNQGVREASCVITAVRFAQGSVRVATAEVSSPDASRQSGILAGKGLPEQDLRAVLLFAPGKAVNGCALVAGVSSVVGTDMTIVGGLAWDAHTDQQTLAISANKITTQQVVAVGLYGLSLKIRSCSQGGWVPFGPLRKVTRCEGNVLLELDGEPALDLYNRYLGNYAKDLPDSGLRFPFEMRHSNSATSGLIRTVLDIDRQRGGVILGGDVDPNGHMRLMHVTTAKLVSGAGQAAACILKDDPERRPGLGLLISCAGRKLIMGDQIADEWEVVHNTLGRHITVTGFYAHGEIGPLGTTRTCKLHNQTMTIALITENT